MNYAAIFWTVLPLLCLGFLPDIRPLAVWALLRVALLFADLAVSRFKRDQ
jgi:hypothetical protein